MANATGILLVDDDEFDQESFESAISTIKDTYLFPIARNGKEALAALANATVLPSYIFMDLDMPKKNGFKCLEEILKDPRTKSLGELSSGIQK